MVTSEPNKHECTVIDGRSSLYWCADHPKPVIACSRDYPGLFLIVGSTTNIPFVYYLTIIEARRAIEEYYERRRAT